MVRKQSKYLWRERFAHFSELDNWRRHRGIIMKHLREESLKPSPFEELRKWPISNIPSSGPEAETRCEAEDGTTIPSINKEKQ